MNKEEGIVSQEDLDQSYAALARMLKNFETRHDKSVLYGSGLKNSTTTPKPQTQTPTTSTSNTITATTQATDTTFRTQQIMEELMTEYEKDLKNPLQGLVFGSLMTAMLIQVQKLKVHTEAALLRGDQVIASNNLTMAISATFPAIAVCSMTYYALRHMWVMSALGVSGMRRAEEDVRLTMVEVDRALLDAYAPSLEKQDEQLPGASIPAPTPSSPSHHHRGSIFSSTVINRENSVDSTASMLPPPPPRTPTIQTVFDQQQPQQRAHVPFRRKSLLTPGTSSNNLNGSGKFDFPTEMIIQEEDVEEDVAGLASYESSLSAKGRLAFQLHRFYNATRVLFRAKMSYLNYGQSLLSTIMAPAANSDWTRVNELGKAVDSNTQWENEFVGIDRDIRDLASPDFEIGGRRKISTASRMRASYQCLQTSQVKS